jgi:glycosyltransferase involved in cell wall biosynthesis
VHGKNRIAIVSPFLDKRHGTERCVAEQIERLARDYEVHLYSSQANDIDLSRIFWHRVPALPGPLVITYWWWFVANQVRRWWDRQFHNLEFDLVFSPGINCLDADVIAVHIVFAEYLRVAGRELALRQNPLPIWPWLIHRKFLYRIFASLEKRIYTRTEIPLAIISQKMERDLARCFERSHNLTLIYHAIDEQHLNPARRQSLRDEVRRKMELPGDAFAILLVGNDWKKKGLPCLVEAVRRLRNLNLWILVRGQDGSSSCRDLFRNAGLEHRVRLLPQVPQIEAHYAAADLYVGPSLEDSFAFPPLEAMACGIPTIVSAQVGASELITQGVDGFILEDPRDSRTLAELIAALYYDQELRDRIGEAAAATARRYTWDHNAAQLGYMFQEVLQRKGLSITAMQSEQSAP